MGYVSLDPDFEFKEAEVASGETSQGHPLLVMGLGLMGLLFILLLAKATVDVEGATGTLSLNLMLTYFDDPTLLAHRGFTVVHFSRLVECPHAQRSYQGSREEPGRGLYGHRPRRRRPRRQAPGPGQDRDLARRR